MVREFDFREEYNNHTHNGLDSKQVEFADLNISPNAAITAPTGGGTVDSEARAAINSLITELENRGFINEN